MALELVYTSATRGLRPGTSGFCTVAMTRGFPSPLVARLEALGGYRPGPSGDGPVARCFWRVETASGIAHVLSAVGPAPPDHTARSNKIATYLVLGPEELAGAGPAWLLSQPGVLRGAWSGAPAWIEEPVRIPRSPARPAAPCSSWAAAAGDAGWAGVLASAFLRDNSKPAHVIYRAGNDPLALVDEAARLLPEWARWRATFSTYFLQPVAGTPCSWRFCLEGTPAADAARQSKGLVIDLARGPGTPADSRFVRMARTGIDEEAEGSGKAAPRQGADGGGEIELEPETAGPSVPAARSPRPRIAAPVEEHAPTGPAGPAVRPAAIAFIAGGCTVLLLLVLLAFVMLRPSSAPAPELAPAAASDVEPAPRSAATVHVPASLVDPPAASPDPAMDVGIEPAPRVPAPPEPTPEPPPSRPAPPEPVPPQDPEASVTAPVAPSPSAVEVSDPFTDLSLPRWSMKLLDEDGAVALRGRADLGNASIKALRFRLPAWVGPSGSLDPASDAVLRFGGEGFRARIRMEGSMAVLEGFASGNPPASLADPTATKPDARAALRRALERCTAEAIDGSGRVVGILQFRSWIGTPLLLGSDRPVPVSDAGDGPIEVHTVPPPGSASPAPVRVAMRESRSVALGAGILVVVDRSVQRAASLVRVSMPSATEMASRRTALVGEIDELNARIADPSADHGDAASRLDAARRELAQLTELTKSAPSSARWMVRIVNPDGIVLLDAAVAPPSATGGRR